MATLRNPLTLREKMEVYLSRQGAQTVGRVLVGAVLGLTIGQFAGYEMLAASAVGITLVGLTAVAQRGIERAKQRMLADFYCDEIAATLGKPAQQVSVADLAEMSRPPSEGGRGSYAIRDAVRHFESNRNFYVVCQAIAASIVIGALLAANFAFSAVSPVMLGGAAALAYNEVFNTVASIGTLLSKSEHAEGTITKDIHEIREQINLGGRVSSTRVFSVFVRVNPALAREIRECHGNDYEQLDIAHKRLVVKQYDPRYHIYHLTQDLNYGAVHVPELGFRAYGQKSGVPRADIVPQPFLAMDDEEAQPHFGTTEAQRSIQRKRQIRQLRGAGEEPQNPVGPNADMGTDGLKNLFQDRIRVSELTNPFIPGR